MMMEIRKVEKMAKEEGAICDPFRARLSFSLAEKLQMTILGVFLVPIRFISAFLALNLAWAGWTTLNQCQGGGSTCRGSPASWAESAVCAWASRSPRLELRSRNLKPRYS